MLKVIVLVGAVGFFWISLMFKSGIVLWSRLIILLFHLLKWAIIIGFLTAFLNMPQLYVYMGWTPISILFGPQIYDKALKQKHMLEPRKRHDTDAD